MDFKRSSGDYRSVKDKLKKTLKSIVTPIAYDERKTVLDFLPEILDSKSQSRESFRLLKNGFSVTFYKNCGTQVIPRRKNLD
jgi:hypothetical protein